MLDEFRKGNNAAEVTYDVCKIEITGDGIKSLEELKDPPQTTHSVEYNVLSDLIMLLPLKNKFKS